REHVDGIDAQVLQDLQVLGDVALGDGLGGRALFLGPSDDLVLHVREVVGPVHLVAQGAQVALHHVADDGRDQVAGVGAVVSGGTAGVHGETAARRRVHRFLGAAQGVVDLNG